MNNVWIEIQKYRSLYPEDFPEPANIGEINLSEKILNVRFSDQYKKFLSEFGAAGIGAYYIYGFKHLPLMGTKNWTVKDKTIFYKENQKWPDIEDWYIVSDDGRGNPIGIDPEGNVWLSDHDSGFEKVKLADNFEEFLHKLLTDTLYE